MISDRLRELGIELPAPSSPGGNYLNCVVDGDMVYASGHGPVDGDTMVTGKVGGDLHALLGALGALQGLDRVGDVGGGADHAADLAVGWRPWLVLITLGTAGCQRDVGYPANYREYAYISNGGSNTVTVLDLVNMRQDRVIAVGASPSGLAVNPRRNEIYVVNSGSGTVTVIDAETNTVAATIRVQRQPYFIDVDAQGERAYVANSGSNNVSVIDLAGRRVVGVIGAGEAPGIARIANNGKTLVISNRASGSVSIADADSFKVRSSFDHCPGATDVMILPDSSKAFIACSGGHQIMVIGLAHGSGSNPAPADVLLTFLDVGKTPTHIALKPDGGEAFVSNYDSDTISELTTSSNEVGGAYLVGAHPVRGLVSADHETFDESQGTELVRRSIDPATKTSRITSIMSSSHESG